MPNAPHRWQFDGGISFQAISTYMYIQIAVDLRPSADGSAVRTSLVAVGGKTAGSQCVYSLGSCAVGETDGRIAVSLNAPHSLDNRL